MRVYYRILGAHVHLRVFYGNGLCGELVFREHEWNSGVQVMFKQIATVLPDDQPCY